MNLDYKEAVAEVLIILEHTEESLINKIPKVDGILERSCFKRYITCCRYK